MLSLSEDIGFCGIFFAITSLFQFRQSPISNGSLAHIKLSAGLGYVLHLSTFNEKLVEI